MSAHSRLANVAWEALYRTQATIGQEFSDADIWDGLLTKEYAVLHALWSVPGGLRIAELGDDALLTQPGMSRLIARLEERGLVERTPDPDDGRATRITLTPAGAERQHRVGGMLAGSITEAMTRALTADQLEQLRDLCVTMLSAAPGHAAAVQRARLERTMS